MRAGSVVFGRSRMRVRRVVLGSAAVVATAALVVTSIVATDASWNDREWVHGTAGTLDCVDAAGDFATRGEGRLLSGSLLGLDTDTVAEVAGVRVTNDGTGATVRPATAAPAPVAPAYADPLDIGVLGGVIGAGMTNILQLPLGTDTGLLGQFAEAHSTGAAAGAAGYVTDSGGLNLDGQEGGYPTLATLRLSHLLDSLGAGLGPGLGGVADVALETGAVAGRAGIDGCAALWNAGVPVEPGSAELVAGLSRDYLAASLATTFTSDTVGALVTAIGGNRTAPCGSGGLSVLRNLECTVNGLASSSGVLGTIESGVVGLLNGLFSNGLSLVDVDVALTATIDLGAVEALLTETLGDQSLQIDLATGEIRIDTAALLARAYPGHSGTGLNGLPPNTEPLTDPNVVAAAIAGIDELLDAWITRVNTALDQAVDGVFLDVTVIVNLRLSTTLLGIPFNGAIGHVEATIDCRPTGAPGPRGCSLADLLNPPPGIQPVKTRLVLLQSLSGIPIIGSLLVNLILNGVVSTVITGLTNALVNGLAGVIGNAVEGVLGSLRSLPVSVTGTRDPITGVVTGGLVRPIMDVVSTLYTRLFLEGLVAVTINARNSTPDPSDAEPPDWAALPEGRYDVAAIRIGVLDALGPSAVRLYLGRGSVGPICHLQRDPAPCAAY